MRKRCRARKHALTPRLSIRCNVLPSVLQADCADFHTSGDKKQLAAVLDTFPLHDATQWLTSPERSGGLGLQLLLEQETGKLFPASNSAREVRDRLLNACEREGVVVRVRASVESMHRDGSDWVCTLADGRAFACEAAVIAAGGLSYPAVGTDGTGYRIARTLGHDLKQAEPYPALVPLAGVHPGGLNSLAGLSLRVGSLKASAGAATAAGAFSPAVETSGGFLFSHKGYTGPCVLNASHAITNSTQQRANMEVNWSGESAHEWNARLSVGGRSSVAAALSRSLPQRLAVALCADAKVDPATLLMSLTRRDRQSLVALLTCYQLPVTGSLGWRLAEVTGGGVLLHELEIPTLQSRVATGVYIVGEMVDVFGRIGGFNFTWAWVSGIELPSRERIHHPPPNTCAV